MAQEYLISIGYINIELEYKIQIGKRNYIIDVYGERKRKDKYGRIETIAIECGQIDAKKLAIISAQFDKVIVWGSNVEFQGTDYTKKIHKLSTELTKHKKDLETERDSRHELENELRLRTYKEERKISLYTTIMKICLHKLVGEPKFQNGMVERVMPRLVQAFQLAYKMLSLEDNGYKTVTSKTALELRELQEKFRKLLPKIEKESGIEDHY